MDFMQSPGGTMIENPLAAGVHVRDATATGVWNASPVAG
jgi:hypothetical protein